MGIETLIAVGSFVTASLASGGIAATIGGAIVGAVVGGIGAAIMGGDIMEGVLFGAIGGAVGGAIGGMFIEGGFFGTELGTMAAGGSSIASPLESGSAMLLGGGEQVVGIGASGHLGVSSATSSLATVGGGGGGVSFGALGDKVAEQAVGMGSDFLKGALSGDDPAIEANQEALDAKLLAEKEMLQMQIDAGIYESKLGPDHQLELQGMRDASALAVGDQRQTGNMETLAANQAFSKSERQAGELREDETLARARETVVGSGVKKQRVEVTAAEPKAPVEYVDTPDTKQYVGA